jgi:hypothetical protein
MAGAHRAGGLAPGIAPGAPVPLTPLATLAPGAVRRPSRGNHGNAPSSWSGPQRCSIVVVAGAARTVRAGTGSTTGTTPLAPRALTAEEPHPCGIAVVRTRPGINRRFFTPPALLRRVGSIRLIARRALRTTPM